MISRIDEEDTAPPSASRGLFWTIAAVVLGAGIVMALTYAPSVTPLLDTLH